MMLTLEERIEKTEQGRYFWEYLVRKYNNPLVLLFCEEEDQFNKMALQHLPSLCQFREKKDVVILSPFPEVLSLIEGWGAREKERTSSNLSVVELSMEDMTSLISLYEMYQFTNLLYLISIEKPYGTKLQHLRSRMTPEDIVKYCIYGLPS